MQKTPAYRCILVTCFTFLTFFCSLAMPGGLSADGLPKMNVSTSINPAPGHIFTALKTGGQSHLVVFDARGVPVFHRRFPNFIENVHPWPDGCISYFDFRAQAYIILNQSQEIMDTIRMKNGYKADFHDFLRLKNGHTVLMGIDLKSIDMSVVVEGGQADATLSGMVIQELDPSGELVFQWDSWDHIEFTDSYADLTAQYIDYIHPNSFWADTDTTLIVSCRNTSELIKINRKDGEIIWRMGGKNNDFTITGDPGGFKGQHAISRLDNGNLLLFDNAIDLENDPWLVKPVDPQKSIEVSSEDEYSRGVEYSLSESTRTLRLEREFYHVPQYQANNMGYIQRIPNGHTLLSWGSSTTLEGMDISEYDTAGQLVFEAGIENNTAQFYKVFKEHFHTELFMVSKDSLDFGKLLIGDSSIIEISISNPGDSDLLITSILHYNQGFLMDSIFPIRIKPGREHLVLIKFKPHEIGPHNDVLTICSDTDTSRISKQVYLSGEGSFPLEVPNHPEIELQLHPNPSDGPLIVTGTRSGDRIAVFNLYGQVIFETRSKGPESKLDLSHLEKGSYIIRISGHSRHPKTARFIRY